jgi:hypothetical protein
MINYIRHDEQFFGAVKLTSGEEVLGEILVSQDPDTERDMIFIQNPAKTKVIGPTGPVDKSNPARVSFQKPDPEPTKNVSGTAHRLPHETNLRLCFHSFSS